MERIKLEKPWRYGRDGSGRTLMLHAGVYVVGKHVPKQLAAKAIAAGAATRMEMPKPKADPPKMFHKMKGPAPENKALDGPGNDKAGPVA